jgi:hypothetical protein
VLAGDARLGRKRVVRRELDAPPLAGDGREAPRDDGDVVGRLVLEDAELGGAVGVEVAVPVEMVRCDVEEDGDARPQLVDVLELEARQLADDPRVGGDRSVQPGQRPADVAGDGDLSPRGAKDLAQELARRRLAVRPGDAQQRVGEDPEAQLDLAPHRDVPGARGGHEGYLARDTGALDQQVHVVDERGILRAQDDFDTVLAKPPGVELVVAVDADDVHPAAGERERRRLARAGEAEDQGSPLTQTRTRSGSRGRTRTRRALPSRSRSGR